MQEYIVTQELKSGLLNIAFLDTYKKARYKINKDVNGGFGTANSFGFSFLSKIIEVVEKKGINFPPLYFASSMSVLNYQGHNCVFINDISQLEKSFKPDLVVLSSSIVCCETELKCISELHSKNIMSLVIGPFAAVNREQYLLAGSHVLVSESDTSFQGNPNLINQIASCDTPQIFETQNLARLDDLPFIDWDLVDPSKSGRMIFLGLGRAVPIYASRGCPYSCYNYCTYPLQQGRSQRLVSPERVVSHIENYVKNYRVKRFLFRDPVFTLNRKHVTAICNLIIDRSLKIQWAAELHLKDLDLSLVKLMKKAGLRCVFVGIETINPLSIEESKRMSIAIDKQKYHYIVERLCSQAAQL